MTSAGNPGNYVDFDEYVGLKLEKTRSTIRTTDVLTALAGVASAFLSYLLLFVIFDQWVLSAGFSVLWRWILLSLLVIATAAWLTWKIGIPSLKTVNGLFAAQEIEKAEPSLKSNLLNLVDLKAAGRPINPSVLKALERQTAVRLQKVDVGQSIDHRPLIRTAYVLLAIIIVFCFYALLSPKKISNSIWRGLFPASRVSVATITEIIEVKPGDLTIPVHQQSVEVQVDVAGEVPEHVTLLYSTSDGKLDQPIELHVEQAGEMRYRGQLIGEGTQGLIHDITYYIRAGDATSRSYKITVEQPPYADIETVRIEHPAYMKIPPIEQSNNPAIEAWEGAKVILTARSNMPVSSAMVQFLDDPQVGPNGEEVPMSIGGSGLPLQATWPLALRSDGTQSKLYRIHCRTSDNRVTTGHVNYPITVKPDLPPEVVLIYPDRDIEVAANATVPLAIQARDPDFELGYIYLNVEKSGQKIFREQISEGRQPKLSLKSDLPMTRLNPAVGDTFEIWIEAFDNKQPRPNSRNTPKIRIHVIPPVSPKDADRQLAEQKDQNDQKLAQSESELNPDRTEPAQQPDNDNQQRDNPNDVAAKDVDRSQKANPQDQNPNDENPQNGEQAKGGQGKSGSAKANEKGQQQNSANKSADQRQNGGSESERDAGGQNDQAGKAAQQNKPLKSDGSQDDEAIQRINQTLKEKNASKPKERHDSSPSDEEEPSKDDDNKTKGKDSNSKSESANQEQKQAESEKPSDKNRKKNDNKADPSSDPKQTQNPDQQDQNSNGQGDEGEPSPSKEGSSESKSDGKSDKPKDRNQQGQKESNKKPSDVDSPNKQPDQDSNSDEPKNDGDAKNDPSKDSKQNSAGKNSEASKDGKKAGDQSESGNKSKSPSQKGGELKDTESGGDDKSPSQSNEKSSKPDSADKGDGKKPKDGSSNAESAPNGDKQPTSDSDSSQKQKADGTEKGVAKPDHDPNSKPETVDNENVKRDPKEKPEIRPGSDPSEPNADRSVEPAEGKGDQGDKQKAVPKKGDKGNDNGDKRSPQDKNDADSDDPESKDAGKPMPDPNAPVKDGNSKEPKSGDKPDNANDSGKPDSKSAKSQGQPPKGEKSKSDAVKNSKPDGSDPKNSKSQEANDSGDEPGDKGESASKSGKPKPDAKSDHKGSKKSEKPDAENQGAKQAGKKPDSDKPEQGKSEQSEDQGGEKGGKENGKDDAKGDGEAKGKEAGKGQSEAKGKGSKPGKGDQPGDAKGESGNRTSPVTKGVLASLAVSLQIPEKVNPTVPAARVGAAGIQAQVRVTTNRLVPAKMPILSTIGKRQN